MAQSNRWCARDNEMDTDRGQGGLEMTRCVVVSVIAINLSLSPVVVQAKPSGEAKIDWLLDAIARVESNRNARAIGDRGRAIGTYQIHKRYWKDGTRFLGVDWSYDQAKNPAKARQVVRAYLLHYGKDKTLLQKARIHNGGPRGHRKKATLRYARRIAQILERPDS
jgi:Destabilase